MNRIQLGKGRGLRVETGHPWVYDNEIASGADTLQTGEVVEIYTAKGKWIGRGLANSHSKIRVRILTRNPEESIDDELIRKKIFAACEYRRRIGYTGNARIIFSESDGLSGLIVDKFGDVLVVQILSAAMEKFREVIVEVLENNFHPKAIVERSDVSVRSLEGLKEHKGFISGNSFAGLVEIEEPGGVRFAVNVLEGQKTGFFLDQKENRLAIEPFVKNAMVADCFSYTGSFMAYAGNFGAKHITVLDQSAEAVGMAKHNAELNGISSRCEFITDNAFDILNGWAREKIKFDTILLDPPAFTKNRAGVAGALRGYKDINLRAMQSLKSGGFLITSSCSHFLAPEMMRGVIFEAARDAGKSVREIVFRHQSPDHPVLWGVEESLYLKFMVLQVMDTRSF